MSHSFGILPSRIVFYEQSDKRLYVNENSARSYRMPEMIEQIVVEGDELYVSLNQELMRTGGMQEMW